MLKGYENINFELCEDDLEWIGPFSKAISIRIGKENAVTNKEIQDKTGLSSQKVHKIIQHIRTNNIVNGICSNGRGYYVAKDIHELEECLISLKQRIYSQMKQSEKDAGTISALMIRFKETRLPRAQRSLEKVNGGEKLSDRDIGFLKRVYQDTRADQSLIKRHPEYHYLVARFIDLYAEIITRGLENEKAK